MDEKLEQAVQPVTFSVPIVQQGYYIDVSQAPAVEVLGDQPALDVPGGQSSAALYPVSRGVETGPTAETRETVDLLDSSAETLPLPPKMPDTSFE